MGICFESAEEKLREMRHLVRLGLCQLLSPIILVTPVVLLHHIREKLPFWLYLLILDGAWSTVPVDGILTLAILKPYRATLSALCPSARRTSVVSEVRLSQLNHSSSVKRDGKD